MHTDPAFLRVSRNTYVLAALHPDRDEWIEEVSGGGGVAVAARWRRGVALTGSSGGHWLRHRHRHGDGDWRYAGAGTGTVLDVVACTVE